MNIKRIIILVVVVSIFVKAAGRVPIVGEI